MGHRQLRTPVLTPGLPSRGQATATFYFDDVLSVLGGLAVLPASQCMSGTCPTNDPGHSHQESQPTELCQDSSVAPVWEKGGHVAQRLRVHPGRSHWPCWDHSPSLPSDQECWVPRNLGNSWHRELPSSAPQPWSFTQVIMRGRPSCPLARPMGLRPWGIAQLSRAHRESGLRDRP